MNILSPTSPVACNFLPKDFKVTVWSRIKPYYKELLNREINSVEALEQWIYDQSELNATLEENLNKRLVVLSVNVNNEKTAAAYNYMVQEICPQMALFKDQLNQRLIESPFCKQLDPKKYFIHLRGIRNQRELYEEKNLDILAEIKVKIQTYDQFFGQTSFLHNGKEWNIGQIRKLLENPDRSVRKTVYLKIADGFLTKAGTMDKLFDELLEIRHQVAQNAGFDNYRDYRFKSLGRFDYTPDDCKRFHLAVKSEVLPLCRETHKVRRNKLEVDRLRPWDLQVNMGSPNPLCAFNDIEDLLNKTVACLSKIHPSFGEYITMLDRMGRLDLEARKGKRPGGFVIPMPISKVPYLFINAGKSSKNVRTLIHESGHAIHDFLMQPLDLDSAAKPPLEVAEMAAMAMELLSMDHWDIFYQNENDLRNAKIDQLEKILNTLPWVATIDRFQHWIYENPSHTNTQRVRYWKSLMQEFQSDVIDWTGYEHYVEKVWHRQPHVFQFPFYYIEYAFAQLGAIAIWKKYRENPVETINRYQKALALGNTRSIKEVYKAAGIAFDFSKDYLRELMVFVQEELHLLRNATSVAIAKRQRLQ